MTIASICLEAIGFSAVLLLPLASFSALYRKWENHQYRMEMREARRIHFYSR